MTVSVTARQLHPELDVFTDEPAEHPGGVAQDGVEVHHPRVQDLGAAHGQELPGQRGRAAARLLDLRDLPAHGVLGRQRPQRRFTPSEDGQQDVVEVVGHPA
jgi:hypothetical protein